MGTPVKLFAYLSAGIPVVANEVGTWTNIVKDEEVGMVTEDDPVQFGSAILEMVENKDLAFKCACRGLELIKNKYSWDISAKTLLDEYNRLLKAC
jgi:glycosyltransferase involved in cell wall biosynthesis